MINYNKLLSPEILKVKPSGIRKFFDLANQMEGVISLGVGEPDFKTPIKIREAAIESLKLGETKYTANAGMAQLKKEISNYLLRRFELDYNPSNELFVTVGGSEAIDLSIRTFVNPGDEVLVVTPSFVCYSPIVTVCHGTVIELQTYAQDNFKLTPQALRAAITSKTKLLILPFPSNPTGAIMTKNELEEIAEIIKQTDIIVVSDEIYAELTYGKRHVSIASIEGMKERTIVINGFSKAYSMTGWRLGYVCGPEPVITQMLKLHQFAIMCAPTTSQYGAIEALKSCDEDMKMMYDEYNNRRKMVVNEFNRIGLTCFEPEGAFYVFPSIESTGLNSDDFCQKLLENEKVAVVPGSAFGAGGDGYIRVSYSYSVEHLKEAIVKIEKFIKSIKN